VSLLHRDTIEHELKNRKVTRLLHSTHLLVNLPQIFRDGFLDTARGLRSRLGDSANRLLHDPVRFEKFTVGLDYINCSLSAPNFELLYARSKAAWKSEWVHLALDLNLLRNSDTLFSPVSAASDFGKHLESGIEGLREMFADKTKEWTRQNLDKSTPTHPQAEVLIRGPIELSHVQAIFVADSFRLTEVSRLISFHKRSIPVIIEPSLFLWPSRLKE
jgi:hypothetical protein